jgi:hypothetical protein
MLYLYTNNTKYKFIKKMQLLLILTLCASLVSGILVKFNNDKPSKFRSHQKNLDTNKIWPN